MLVVEDGEEEEEGAKVAAKEGQEDDEPDDDDESEANNGEDSDEDEDDIAPPSKKQRKDPNYKSSEDDDEEDDDGENLDESDSTAAIFARVAKLTAKSSTKPTGKKKTAESQSKPKGKRGRPRDSRNKKTLARLAREKELADAGQLPGTSKDKGRYFNEKDDLRVCQAYYSETNDPDKGTGKKMDHFWQAIATKYNLLADEEYAATAAQDGTVPPQTTRQRSRSGPAGSDTSSSI